MCARVRIGNIEVLLPARRLCGRFGADYGFVLSLIPFPMDSNLRVITERQ